MSRHTRRKLLKTTGTGLAGGLLAGCLGGDGGDGGGGDGGDGGGGDGGDGGDATPSPTPDTGGEVKQEFTFTTGTSSSAAYAMATGMSALIQEKSGMKMNVTPSSGSTTAMIQMMQGQTELSYGYMGSALDALNGEGRFSDVDGSHPLSAFHSYYWLYFAFVVPTDSDLQYHSDLVDVPFAFGTGAESFHPVVQLALESFMPADELNIKSVNVAEWGAEMSAGNIMAAPFLNVMGIAPSYVQQLLTQNDVRMLGWKDESIQAVRDHPRATGAMYSNDNPEYEPVSEFVDDGETFQISVPYLWYASDMTNEATIYELLTTLFENREQLPDIHAAFGKWTEPDFWPSHFQADIPIHPGAEKFFKEQGMWNDDWQVVDL